MTNARNGEHSILTLQRTLGNQAVQDLHRRGELPPALGGARPVEESEQEPEQVEEKEGRMQESAPTPPSRGEERMEAGTAEAEAVAEAEPETEVEAETEAEPGAEEAVAGEPAAGTGAAPPGDTTPRSPEEDPAFQAVVEQIETVATEEQVHPPAEAAATEAQAAAKSPPDEVARRAEGRQVTEMAQVAEQVQQGPPPFDKEAFKATLLQKVATVYPGTLEDVERFKDDNKLASVKSDLVDTVDRTKQKTKGPIEEKAKEEPDTTGLEPKPTKDLESPQAGSPPPGVGAARAAPKPKSEAAVSTPFQERSQSLEQQLAETGVPEETLEHSSQPEFTAAIQSKREAQSHAAQAPVAYRQHEGSVLSGARSEAEGIAQTQTGAMHGDRSQLLDQVEGLQEQTSTADTEKRAEITARFESIYKDINGRVETRLQKLDKDVNDTFDKGADQAVRIFEDHVDTEMRKFKEERYSGWGTFLRVTDWAKITTLPSKVEAFYKEGRRLFLEKMNATIDQVADIVMKGLADAHDIIDEGRQRVEEERANLPESLKDIGEKAASDIRGRFDQLEQTVDAKKDQLIDSLAQKYVERLQHVDARIEELKAENQSLFSKAWDAVAGVVQTITQLKDLLLGVLSKAAAAVTTIIKDPIGFFGNLVDGVKQGLDGFVSKIGTYLQAGLIEWLTGTLTQAGIQLPEQWDLKGIFGLLMQLLGLTYENIRAQAVKVLGEETVSALEKAFEIFRILITEGVAGLWQYVKDQIGDLKAMVLDKVRELVATQVVEAGIKWILGLLGPVGAFIKAAKAIYDVVTFFIQRAREVLALVDAVLDSILAIAQGNVAGAAKLVEEALARSVPILIGFLANLLGLGDLPKKIRGVIEAIQAPINKAVQWVIEQAKQAVRRLGSALGIGKKDEKEAGPDERSPEDKKKDLTAAMDEAEVLLRDPTKSIGDVKAALSGIKSTYRLTTIDLVTKPAGETTESAWVEGSINPDEKTPVVKKDISSQFKFEEFEDERGRQVRTASGQLGVPGQVVRHRDEAAQRRVSGGTGDDAGHFIADVFGAPGDERNLSRQNWRANRGGGTYRRMEQRWETRLEKGSDIHVRIREYTPPGTTRPTHRIVSWTEVTRSGKVIQEELTFFNASTPRSREKGKP